MALKVGELFATLNLDDKDFGKKLKSAKTSTSTLEKALQSAQASVKRYQSSWGDVSAKLTTAVRAQDNLKSKLSATKQAQAELSSRVKELNEAYKLQVKVTGDNSNAANELGVELLDAKEALAKTNTEVKKLSTEARKGDTNIAKLETTLQNVSSDMGSAQSNAGKLRAELSAANAVIKSHAALFYNAGTALETYSKSAKKTAELQDKVGSALTAGVTLPIIGGLGYGTKTTISLEQAFAGVRKTVDATDAEFDQMYDQFLRLAEVIPLTAEELMELGAAGGQMGIAKDVIVDFADTMAALEVSTNLDEAATTLAQFANIMGTAQTGENFERIGSTIVDLGNKSATTEKDIANLALNLAGAGRQVGMSEADILGISAALSSLGIQAEAGGSSFSTLLSRMQVAVETGNDDLKSFAEVAHMTSAEFQTAFREDAAGALAEFVSGLGSGSSSAIKILDEIGLTEIRMRRALLGASNASELFVQSIQTANSAWAENKALAQESSKFYATTGNRLKTLGNRARNVASQFGNTLVPTLEEGMDIVGGLVDQFANLDESTRKNIVNWALMAAAVGPAIKAIGKMNGAIGSLSAGVGGLLKNVGSTGLLKGIAKSIISAIGPAGIAIGAVTLTGYAVYKLTNKNKSLEQLKDEFSQALAKIEVSEELIANVTADFEFTDASGQAITDLYDLIGDKLTDGELDTPKIINELEEKTRATFAEIRDDIEDWYADEMQQIDLDSEGGQAQLEKLTEMRDQYQKDVTQAEESTVSWINTMGGQSTAAVQQHIGQLEELMGKVTTINAEITKAAELAQSTIGDAYTVVTSGMSVDSTTISNALNYAYQSWNLDTSGIKAHTEEQMAAAQQAFAEAQRGDQQAWQNFLSGGGYDLSLDYIAWEKMFQADQTKQTQLAKSAYLDQINAIFDGIASALGPAGKEFQADAQRYIEGLNISSTINDMLAGSEQLTLGEMDSGQISAIREGVSAMLKKYADIIGEEYSGADELLTALDVGDSTAFNSMLYDLKQTMDTAISGSLDDLTTSLGDEQIAPMAQALTMVMNSAMLQGVEGIDISNVDSQFAAIAGELGKETQPFVDAGTNYSAGIAKGITNGKSRVISASNAVAAAAISAFRSRLQIASPSKVMEKQAGFVPLGVAKGIIGKTYVVGNAMRQLANTIQRGAIVRNPGSGVRAAYAAQATANTQTIDYDRLADAMERRDTVLVMDGKVVARMQTNNNARAANARSRAIALGYGK